MTELIEADHEKAAASEHLASYIETFLNCGLTINKALDIQENYERDHGFKVKLEKIRGVLVHLLGYRYTKIVQIPIHGNSERCLV